VLGKASPVNRSYTSCVGQDLRHSGTAELVFFFFLLFVSIILMNLLIGLAISNIHEATSRSYKF
jgi:hypothetical protein